MTFSDPPPLFTKEQVDKVLREAQAQMGAIENIDKALERSREYLSKAVKSRDEWSGGAGPSLDEDILLGGAGYGANYYDDFNT